MLLWILTFFLFLVGISVLLSGVGDKARGLLLRTEERLLLDLEAALVEIQGRLETGLLPSLAHWSRLSEFREPWGSLCKDSLDELRQSGGALLPTLKRFRELARAQGEQMRTARARASQALSQAAVGALLVPLMAVILNQLLPGVAEAGWVWWMGVGMSFCLSTLGGVWLLSMAEQARWGGLHASRRSWALEGAVAGERFISFLRAGIPPDLAWARVCEGIRVRAPGLAEAWGYQMFGGVTDGLNSRKPDLFSECGDSIRMSVQISVMEGRPCAERVEQVVESFRRQWRDQVERELNLLGTRALKPLFVCVAPSLLGLLAFGMALAWDQTLRGV